ncbi:molybdopterin-dependent oxidoreductase alpha subunit [Jatrophihabitans sp. GAS493]|uniref:FdhF/YdeP family oxidoreductase n=1 Tax=Jatrophihabitans sp. GAS493 TaxID=1907575 RepID=UPI000BB7EE13|nr:FdhF/YdeP family oxidoreductase [Jatrophihabitans sp. GAS493]SOD73664.1 molybdopterin-dependent oxidoreductase alpha subunit [Jatrophihabitans sp. GAS493]
MPDSDRIDPVPTEVSEPKTSAVGLPGILHSMQYALAEMGPTRTAKTLSKMNHVDGFDCPSCAWPDPDRRKAAEFCENGAKAVSWEATRKHIGADFFAEHPVAELREMTDHWLEAQGRLTEPLLLAAGDTHYRPVSWKTATTMVADSLRNLANPNRAAFYTSGRASNEAAFVYQLLARQLGTNNLPDCSNMCHESSGSALTETLGIGKGSVTLDDLTLHAELIVIVGQNPGTNHPRMLTALEDAKRRGARIVAINPLPEAGLQRFRNPQRVSGILGRGTKLADRYLAVRVNGDLALFNAVNRLLVERDESAAGPVLDHDFIREYTDGFDQARAGWLATDWPSLQQQSGLDRHELEQFVDDVVSAKSIVVCWAMGLTQHKNSVATIREITNFLLLRGNIGRPGAGVCPVRGHSNVQGDRTMGIYEKPAPAFLDALRTEFGFDPPREHGHDTVDTIRAMRDGQIDVFIGLGGNFALATPDTAVTEAALERCDLTVQISTKLNRSHLRGGRQALILPCLGRTERDIRDGVEQFVTVEDSMSMVHSSRGRLPAGSDQLRSEVAIVTAIGDTLFGSGPDDAVAWRQMGNDYRIIRKHIEHVVPGFHAFEERIANPGGFILPNPPRDAREFKTDTGRAHLTVNPPTAIVAPPGHLILQTVRSHDQFNTTIYGLDDRYRGIHGGRMVVFVNADDLREQGISDGAMVDIVSVWGSEERRAAGFRVVSYETPKGCAAAYYPETNVLIPLDSTADVSNTPTSKSIVVRLEPQRG